jgi:uncharacterized protein YwgA
MGESIVKKSDFLLCVIDAKGEHIRGRTLLQKTCYFVLILLGRLKESDFKAHFYGPYSPALDETLNEMVSLAFIQQRQVGFGAADSSGFEIRRNDFELTEAGKEIAALIKNNNPAESTEIQNCVRKIREAGDPNYLELSIAAKVYFIVSSRDERLTKQSIVRYAQSLGWSIEHDSIDKAVSFLQRLDLVENS